MPNIIAAFDGEAGSGRHLVLNGHMDVFPVGDRQGWKKDCWGGEVGEGRIWGRYACDMKSARPPRSSPMSISRG
ncbi:M20/M25/M40 family metallo-hydrolase [Bradyrhizobium sp. 38]|nr:M20/M25/M40 family metallo-hydrolase [Bradyrhizobium sp. 38]MCK1775339.1 M20/M25/M40 family metallo-hydrolase [Bradyrhizobium sp. 132]